jgi:hypothetical protein
MCIAAIIHVPLSKEYLDEMDISNPHGGGVAWLSNGELCFRRGLVAKEIYEMQENGELTYPYLLHFRWATHGPKIAQLTHPFPTGIRAFLGELQGTADEVMIHNGVWGDYTDWVPLVPAVVPDELLASVSDTAVAAYFYAEFPELGSEIPWAVASARVGDDGKMAIVKHGRWQDYKGNEYSNLHWLPAKEYGLARGWEGYFERKAAAATPIKGDWNPDEDFEAYCRRRYGDEVTQAIMQIEEREADAGQEWPDKDSSDDDAVTIESMIPTDDFVTYDDLVNNDLVSEDPESVNEWLGRKIAVGGW